MTHGPCGVKVVAGTCGSGDPHGLGLPLLVAVGLPLLVAVGLMTHSSFGFKVVAGTCGSGDTHGLRYLLVFFHLKFFAGLAHEI